MFEGLARRHPRAAAALLVGWNAYALAGLARMYADPDAGVPMMVWSGSAVALVLFFDARPWEWWTRRDAPRSRSRSAPRWPLPAPSPFRRTRRIASGVRATGPRR